jgi:hypothetical protein
MHGLCSPADRGATTVARVQPQENLEGALPQLLPDDACPVAADALHPENTDNILSTPGLRHLGQCTSED